MKKTNIEKLQEFLDYYKAFEKKARELLNAPKRDNRAVKMWFIRESDGYVKVQKELLSFLLEEGKRGIISLESMMLRDKIQESMEEIQHLTDEIVRLPLKEEEMQK
jgi:hypothetical protein